MRIPQRRIATIAVICAGMLATTAGSESVSFSWAANSEPYVAGYRIHYGTASRSYDTVVDVGNVTVATIGNLAPLTTYYFALGAYNVVGVESDLTGELVYSVPATPTPAEIHLTSANPTVLTVTGPTNRAFNIEATTNLQTWTTIGTVTLEPSGLASFTDTNTAFSRRFYRARAL